jgi:hypothetical protein
MKTSSQVGLLALGTLAVLGAAAWVALREPLGRAGAADPFAGAVSTSARMALPPERPCLAGPSDVAEEDGIAASEGLDPVEASRAVRAFAPRLLPCFRGAPTVTMDLEITVACSGRVSKVDVADDGGAGPTVARCVGDTLKYAPFPAHALPDGDTFEYPLSYTAPS